MICFGYMFYLFFEHRQEKIAVFFSGNIPGGELGHEIDLSGGVAGETHEIVGEITDGADFVGDFGVELVYPGFDVIEARPQDGYFSFTLDTVPCVFFGGEGLLEIGAVLTTVFPGVLYETV